MNLKLTNQQILSFFNQMANVGNLEIEFTDSLMVHDLALNKKSLEVHFEALKLMDKVSPEFKKYQREIASARNRNVSDNKTLKSDIEKIESEFVGVKEREIDRRDKWNDLLEKTVDVKNIKLLDRFDEHGELTIKGKGGKELQFIIAIEPFFKCCDGTNDDSVKVTEKKK